MMHSVYPVLLLTPIDIYRYIKHSETDDKLKAQSLIPLRTCPKQHLN